MKSYDLLTGVNGRATFMISKICLPHLIDSAKNGRNPHILNNAPPLDLRPERFSFGLAYTISKHDMTLCALGMSEEFRGTIAVNSLWPKIPVLTAASAMQAKDFKNLMRDPEIFSDAAYGIFCEDTSYSGNFLLDEDYLRTRHFITDFQPYQLDKSISPKELEGKIEKLRSMQRAAAKKTALEGM